MKVIAPGAIAGEDRTKDSPWPSRIALVVARLGGCLIRALPRRLADRGADRIADVAFVLARTCRARAVANVRQVLGHDADEQARRCAREAFRTSVHNMADLLRLQGTGPASFARAVVLREGDWSMLERAAAHGRGVVLVTAHLGAFDGLGLAFAASGYRLTVVVGRTLPRAIFDVAIALRGALGMTIVEATPAGVRQMIDALRRGECVGFPNDRDFFRNGTPVVFFGRRTTLPSGAVRIARETGAPIVAVYLRRTATGYDLVLEEPFLVPRTANRQVDVAAGMDRVVASLTRAVAATPGQWAVFQPVWPTAAADAIAEPPSRCRSSS